MSITSSSPSFPSSQVEAPYSYDSVNPDNSLHGFSQAPYNPQKFETTFQVYKLNDKCASSSQFAKESIASSPETECSHTAFSSTSNQSKPNCPKIPSKRKKFQKQLNDSACAGSSGFPASREPDLICDPTHDNCLARTNHLALGMLRILDKYSLNQVTPKPTPLLPISSIAASRRDSLEESKISEPALPSTIRQIKYDLTTTLRNTIPLNHLQKIAKHHDFKSILWYPCNFPNCFSIYQNRRSLRRHIFSHTGETPHSCKFPGCNKAYTSSDRLKEHIHSHTNQRPYKCTALGCSKAYNDSKTLREHKLTHGEKLFLCEAPGCSKSFHRKTHLKQHMQTHSRDLAI